METTVTVTAVNAPKPGGKRASIKTSQGGFIGFYPDKLQFVPGKTYRLLVEESQWQGKTYFNAERIIEEIVTTLPQMNGSGGGITGGSVDRYWLPCVSNTIAHAIQAGFITEPLQIKVWAAAAKEALTELDRPPAPKSDADDQPPF